MKRTFLLPAILILACLACQTSSLMETFVPAGGVLFQDNFSNETSGWGGLTLPAGAAGYSDKTYRIVVDQPDVNIWSHPGLVFSNVHAEVSVFPAAGPLENRMGLICRLVDDQNFYFFVISGDGYYGIGKMKTGQVTLLTGNGQMLPSPAIQIGNVPNQVRGDCVDNQLNLTINGQPVDSAQDSDFTSGDVGILAGTFSQPGADVYFDNFFAFKP